MALNLNGEFLEVYTYLKEIHDAYTYTCIYRFYTKPRKHQSPIAIGFILSTSSPMYAGVINRDSGAMQFQLVRLERNKKNSHYFYFGTELFLDGRHKRADVDAHKLVSTAYYCCRHCPEKSMKRCIPYILDETCRKQ